jgi:hypothetical protein
MYCPKCGARMDAEGEIFKCVRGEMVLSMDLAKGLYQSFVARSVPPIEPTPSIVPSGRGLVLSRMRDSNGRCSRDERCQMYPMRRESWAVHLQVSRASPASFWRQMI